MDAKNLFETPVTSKLHRAEYGLGLVVASVLFFAHLGDVSWPVFVGLFLYIDLIGYIPGAIAFHRSATKEIPKVYYVLYNTMHSLVTQGLVTLVWIWAFGAEWALLALPIHLFGDRALFGNFLKSFGLPFEPVADPGYLRFRAGFEGTGGTDEQPRPVSARPAARTP
ncbi:hypothetical protein [Streptomyces sp. NPDC003717]|uniref:hypothetical protein n=1 Tax=Streptomyces sp. NPDC003717 TaxID=3154276 RepID=UPI0033B6E6D1